MGKTNRWGISALVAGLALAACSPTTSDRTQQTCTWAIGIMGAIEGDIAEYGGPPARGVEIAVALANEAGDLACALETRSENTEGDPKEAPRFARKLVNDEDLVACVCGYFSGETHATGDVFERGGVAMLSTEESSRTRDRGFGTWFRLVAPADRQAAATALYIKRVMAPKRVVIVSDGFAYSREVARTVKEGLGWRFEPPVIRLATEELRDHFASRAIRRMSADLVFFAGYGAQAWPLLDYMREYEDPPLSKLPFVTDGGAMGSEAEGWEVDGGLLSCGCSDAAALAGGEAFVAEHRARYDSEPGPFALEAFDGANAVVDALRELDGTETIEEVRAHVVGRLRATAGFEGVVKDYAWEADGELITDDRHVWMWERRGGAFRVLGSVAELTNEP